MGKRALILGALAALALTGCGGDFGDSGGRLRVLVTTTQLGDITRAIGGSTIDVAQILQPNTDPHEYEPRPRDVESAGDAQLVVRSGDNLDRWLDDVLSAVGGSPTVLDAGAGRPDRQPGESSGAEASRYDPHWWHDPANVAYAVDRIRDAIIRAEPSARATVEANAARYEARLRRLDAGIRACFATVPPSARKLVTDHDAFGYFAHRYGVSVVGAVIPSQSTQAQPSVRDISKLSDLVKREGVKAIFPESSVNEKLAQALARQTGATAKLTLYGDTLGPKGSPGATYLTMEQANADAMVRGFTGGREGCSIRGL